MFTKIIRRIHMYLALFLMPWMMIYALSTAVMNHRESISRWYDGNSPHFVREKEMEYDKTFPDGSDAQTIGAAILQYLGLDGAHNVRGGKGQPIVITRNDPVAQKRITYDPAKGSLLIEREEYRTPAFLERMHRRRGYQQPYLVDDVWGFTVDLAMLAIVGWCLSGLWMWWTLQAARRWAVVSLASGFVLFALFLVLI